MLGAETGVVADRIVAGVNDKDQTFSCKFSVEFTWQGKAGFQPVGYTREASDAALVGAAQRPELEYVDVGECWCGLRLVVAGCCVKCNRLLLCV